MWGGQISVRVEMMRQTPSGSPPGSEWFDDPQRFIKQKPSSVAVRIQKAFEVPSNKFTQVQPIKLA
jgi:hypothetical protein